MEERRVLGQCGYEAYGETAGWKTFDGRPMPTWEELGLTDTGQETRRRWEVAARAIDEAGLARPVKVPLAGPPKTGGGT